MTNVKDKNDIQSYALPKHTIVNNGESHYCVEEVLGAGGFGITYKVSTIIQDRGIKVKTFLAMKELFIKSKGCYRDADHTRMLYAPTVSDSIKQSMGDFLKEAKRISQLGSMSPNIVQVYEVFEANGTAYYVMEYLDGQDLSHNIKKNVGLNEKQALSYIISIAHAVDILHKEQVLHLDIKPDNIVLKRNAASGEQIPVLIDFGLSKHFDKKGRPTTQPNAKGVSDGYAPMEQYGGTVNHFAPEMDIYALGATLYFMLTGNTPPAATESPSTKTLLSALPPETSNNVKTAISGAMQLRAEERTHSVTEFLAIIEPSHTLPIGTLLVPDFQPYNIVSKGNKYRILEVVGETYYEITYKAIRTNRGAQDSTFYGGRPTTPTDDYTFYHIHESFFPQDKRNGCEVEGNMSLNDRILEFSDRYGDMACAATDFDSFCANNTAYVATPIFKPQPLATRIWGSFKISLHKRIYSFKVSFGKLKRISDLLKTSLTREKKIQKEKSSEKKQPAKAGGIVWNGERFINLLFSIYCGFMYTMSIRMALDSILYDKGLWNIPFFIIMFAPLTWASFCLFDKIKSMENGIMRVISSVAFIFSPMFVMIPASYIYRNTSPDFYDQNILQDSITISNTTETSADEEHSDSAVIDNWHNDVVKNDVVKKEEKAIKGSPKEENEQGQKANRATTPEENNSQRLAKAMQKGDWSTIQSLAVNGYANAYAPLAEHYLSVREYDLANNYAQKAKHAGVGTSKANAVIAQLKRLGYYDFNNYQE